MRDHTLILMNTHSSYNHLPDKMCLFLKISINNRDVYLGFSLFYSIPQEILTCKHSFKTFIAFPFLNRLTAKEQSKYHVHWNDHEFTTVTKRIISKVGLRVS